MTKKVTILDYGHGNANSIRNALSEIGAQSVYSARPDDIEAADALILPGVGHHRSAMVSLLERNLVAPLRQAALDHRKPILGICLGMQLMTESSEEGGAEGLAFVRSRTRRIVPEDRRRFKVPHVGWNTIASNPSSTLLRGIDTQEEPFYFCHSFAIEDVEGTVLTSTMTYDRRYVAVFEQDNLYGVQFHPEKSQDCGLKLLENFLNL
jgi:imidazole glycerol-phosphate synthase subunit HisH